MNTNKTNNKSEIPYCIYCKHCEMVDFEDGTYDLQCWKNSPFYEIVDEYDGCDDYIYNGFIGCD